MGTGTGETPDTHGFTHAICELQGMATIPSHAEKLTIKLPARSGKEIIKSGDDRDDIDNKHTFCPVEHQEPIIGMMECHFCAHLLIPRYLSPCPEGIHKWVEQLYKYCHDHDLPEVWAYLWENWYHQG